jgi:hypothetical protein
MEDKRIRAALETVAREKCKRGFWISSDDEKVFNDALQKVDSRKGQEYSTQVESLVFENKTNESYTSPEMSHGYEQMRYEGNVAGDVQGSVKGAKAGVTAQCSGFSVIKGEKGQQWTNENQHHPSQTRIVKLHGRHTTVSYITYACQVDLRIRVYARKHVKDGAAGVVLLEVLLELLVEPLVEQLLVQLQVVLYLLWEIS